MEEIMNEKILKNRDRIDNADEQIFDLLLERLDAVTAIGHIKKQEGLPVLDKERENAIYEKTINLKSAIIKYGS